MYGIMNIVNITKSMKISQNPIYLKVSGKGRV